jgi:hypothetical protein
MNLKEFCDILKKNEDQLMHFMFLDKKFIPPHYHVTEVGLVKKDFIDCGGTVRSNSSCVLQVLVADDIDHRLHASKLIKIMDMASSILNLEDLPMEIEFENKVISQFPIIGYEPTPCGLLFYLGDKHTACLAPDKCGINTIDTGCCGGGGCCGG